MSDYMLHFLHLCCMHVDYCSLRQKINAVTLPNGASITPYTNDDTSEDQPIVFDNEGYDETQLLEGMKHESNQMKLHDVYDEVDTSTVDDNVIREAIPTRWVHRKKGPGVRSRIVAKGYTEKIEDEDSVYASTPMFTTLRSLLALQMSRPKWTLQHCYTHPSRKTTTASTSGHLKNFVHNRTKYGD